jgi:regulator of PEP synthase PpsR (kinase-PPPase family)
LSDSTGETLETLAKAALAQFDDVESMKHFWPMVRSEGHLQQLMDREPIWDLLQHDEFISKLFHVAEHGDVLKKLKPDTIEKLAAVIAIIRPAKRYLAICTWEQILKEVWIKPENDQYFFKKAHAIAYAHVIVVQMNLLCEQLQKGVDNE